MLVSATYIDVVCGVIAAACGVLMIVGLLCWGLGGGWIHVWC